MIKATRNGIETFFSDADWKTGQPQRYGWVERGAAALKTIPKEIIDFVSNKVEKKKDEPKEDPNFATGGIVTGTQTVELNSGERVVPIPKVELKAIEKKPKKDKDNGNTKPKDGKTRNRKPRTVGKT